MLRNKKDGIKIENIKSIITAKCSRDTNTTTDSGYTLIPLDTFSIAGSKLSIDSNRIIIGKDVNYVRVSANMRFASNQANNRVGCVVKKNGIEYQSYPTHCSVANVIYGIGTGTTVFSVQEGDYFELFNFNANYSSAIVTIRSGLHTNLTVEVVE